MCRVMQGEMFLLNTYVSFDELINIWENKRNTVWSTELFDKRVEFSNWSDAA